MRWTVLFFSITIISGIFGFFGLVESLVFASRIIFVVFALILLLIFIRNKMRPK